MDAKSLILQLYFFNKLNQTQKVLKALLF